MTKLYNSSHNNQTAARIRGFSYVEVLLSVVIISVLLVSALKLSANLGRSQQAGTDQQQYGNLVIDLLEEIKQQAYKDPNAVADSLVRETGELIDDRSNYNDIDDYHGWSASPPENRWNTPFPQFAHLTRSVSVRFVSAADFTLTSAGDEGFKEVTITITRNRDSVILEERKFVLADYQP